MIINSHNNTHNNDTKYIIAIYAVLGPSALLQSLDDLNSWINFSRYQDVWSRWIMVQLELAVQQWALLGGSSQDL